MMWERPNTEIEEDTPPDFGEWPPDRATRLTKQVIHRVHPDASGSSDRQQFPQENDNDDEDDDETLQPRSRQHRANEPQEETSER